MRRLLIVTPKHVAHSATSQELMLASSKAHVLIEMPGVGPMGDPIDAEAIRAATEATSTSWSRTPTRANDPEA